MNVGFISLGCAKNLVDSEFLIGLFDEPNFNIQVDPAKCELIIINTCGFIESAKKEAIDTILEMADLKNDKLKYLIVTGCLVQRYYDDLIVELPEVDLFIKIDDYKDAHNLIGNLIDYQFINHYGKNRKLVNSNASAYLKISDGCDNRCAYCAIPLIRGNNRSIPIEDLVFEAKRLYDLGVRELNVVAQDTTVYGKDLYGKLALKDLLVELDKIDFKWIRLLYMYPDEITDDLLSTLKSLKHFIPYFDLPVQYGNDEILKLMNRRGTVSLIEDEIRKIRKMFKDAYIRTTLIVGFPHETDKTFNDTLEFIKRVKFDSLGAFTYSKEEDTAAFNLENQVEDDIKNDRYNKLMLCQKSIIDDKFKQKISKTYEVLIENKTDEYYVSRSYESSPDDVDSYIYVKADNLTIGQFVKVVIDEYKDYDFYAHIL